MVYLLEKKTGKSTVARNISSLKSFFKFLNKKGVVKTSPLNLIEIPKIDKRLPSFIKESEIVDLINSIEFDDSFSGLRDKLLIMLFYQTGIRLSEIIGLNDSSIRGDEVKVLGKRNKERIIPISKNVKEVVSQYLVQKAKEFPNSDYFFITDSGNKMYEKFVYRKVNHYLSLVSSKQKKESPHFKALICYTYVK
jgi:integrase/recombinase XerC